MPNSASRPRRGKNNVNAGSMADIAFLLLIFFLVSTQIVDEKGILVKLPPFDTTIPEFLPVKKRNLFVVKINSADELLVRNERLTTDRLKVAAKEFIGNPQNRPDMAENPRKALISLQNDRGTHYDVYLTVYNELQAAYRELREEEAQRRYGTSFSVLGQERQKEIRAIIPLVISEAEPTEL